MTLDGHSVLITGGGGQLASDIAERLCERCEVAAPGRAELDITDQSAVDEAFARLRPAVVFNCAAFHNVNVCEREEDRSFEVNARAVKRLAQLCADGGARLVHLSTNYVFAGDRDEPYAEGDLPSPRSVYAISKLAGEHAALAYCADALVVRGSGLYGRHGSVSKGGNFVQRMLTRAREQGALKMVADQRLTPTYTADLADALIAAVEGGVGGLLHVTNSGACSWHEFTVAIMEVAGVDVPVEPVRTVRPPSGADRPLNGVLSCERACEAGVTSLRPWKEALGDYMASVGQAAEASLR
ncbi:MAG TPA: dTDP-4-dehydrorhamnose reductase [Thermoleophilaceae bacterium]|nr:dTDP-4-dehydrorhamnose reductase [Thermoleophilaceae bacterium]